MDDKEEKGIMMGISQVCCFVISSVFFEFYLQICSEFRIFMLLLLLYSFFIATFGLNIPN